MAYAPTLTASTDQNPGPRVLVTFATVAAGTQMINVSRVVEGRTVKVRGGVGLFAVGGASVMDYEPAIGLPSVYRAEMFDSAGLSLGFTDSASTTIAATVLPDASYGFINQPLNPSLMVLASLHAETSSDMVRGLPGDVFYAEGAPLPTRIGGHPQALTGMALTVICGSFADADEFRSMFGGYGSDYPAVICVRTAPPVRMPRVLYASPRELHEATDYINNRVTFQLTVDEVMPPSPGLIVPLLRRDDIDAAFATRTARAAAYATRLARDTDYSKAGLAG